jgi:hypothetical protein
MNYLWISYDLKILNTKKDIFAFIDSLLSSDLQA